MLSKNVNNEICAPKLRKVLIIFDIDFKSQVLALFDTSPLTQFPKFNIFLWVCWLLGKNLSNLAPPPFENSTTRIAIVEVPKKMRACELWKKRKLRNCWHGMKLGWPSYLFGKPTIKAQVCNNLWLQTKITKQC